MKNGSTYYELKLIILLHCPDHVVSLLSSSLKFSSLSHDSSFICLLDADVYLVCIADVSNHEGLQSVYEPHV